MGTNTDLKVGDRVYLSEDHNWPTCSQSNPTDVVGVVENFDKTFVYVNWDNGWANSYTIKGSDLIPEADYLQEKKNKETNDELVTTFSLNLGGIDYKIEDLKLTWGEMSWDDLDTVTYGVDGLTVKVPPKAPVSKVIIHYEDGSSYTYKDATKLYLFWDECIINIIVDRTEGSHVHTTEYCISAFEVIAVECINIEDNTVTVHKNPKYNLSVQTSIMTAKKRCKVNNPNDITRVKLCPDTGSDRWWLGAWAEIEMGQP